MQTAGGRTVEGIHSALRSADSVWFAFGFVVIALGVTSCGGRESHDVHPAAAPVVALPPAGATPPVSAVHGHARRQSRTVDLRIRRS